MEMLKGTLLSKRGRRDYARVELGGEIGYELKTVQCYIRDETIKEYLLANISVGDKVLVTGTRANCFILESIMRYEFIECDICCRPLYADKCIIKHDNRSTKICGAWRIVHRRDSKLFLEQNNYVISVYGKRGDFFYDIIKAAKISDIFTIIGWQGRDGNVTIKHINLI